MHQSEFPSQSPDHPASRSSMVFDTPTAARAALPTAHPALAPK
jgi:hypothetical protein